MSRGSLKNPKTKICKAPNEKTHHLLAPQRSGGHRMEPGFKRENVYKVEQDVGRVGEKTYPRVTSPLFSLLNPAGLPFLFFCQKKNPISFNPQKGLARLLQSCVSGCFKSLWSFLLRSRGPRSSVGTSSALGKQGLKMLRRRRRRRRPGGLSARGRAARRRAPAGRKLSSPRAQASVGAAGAPSPGRGWPPGLLA